MPSKSTYAAIGGIGLLWALSRRDSEGTMGTTGGQHTLEITRAGEQSRQISREYSVTVTGSIRPLGNVEQADIVDGNTARGYVTAYTDTYVFTGSISSMALDDGLKVMVDGADV